MDLSTIKQRLVEGDAQGTVDAAREALASDIPAEAILRDALIPGMEEVGDLFARNEYFVPELLLSARAMHTALDVLRPLLVGGG